MLLVLIALLAQISFTACSDDEPDKGDDQQSAEWRKDLWIESNIMSHTPLCGIPDLSYTPAIGIVDQSGRDLLNPANPNNVLKSDFYFEYEGNKYFYGDTIFPVAGMTKKVWNYMGKDCYTYSIAPFILQWREVLEMKQTLDIKYDFVWPSQNIRHTVRTYVEPNTEYTKQFEEFMADTANKELVSIEVYKYGLWVDGASYPPMGPGRWFKIVVDSNK